MDPLKAKANFARICQLLVDKGGDALRLVLHAKIYPSSLTTVLNAKKADLLKLTYPIKKPPVINDEQWKLLYPTSGALADAEKFDITLLTILLTNICALPPPVSGWLVMPPSTDTTISADILRIKTFRNKVYGHIAKAEYDDPTFETLWKEISKPLINLGIPQRDIDELKSTYLSPEEKSYIEKLKEWKELENVLLAKLRDVEAKVGKVEGEAFNFRDEVVSVKDELVSVKDEVVSVKDEVVSVKNEVVSVKDEVVSVKHEVVSVKDEVVSVKDEVVSVKDEVHNVKDEVVSVKDEVVSVKHEVVSVKDEVVSVKDEIVSVKDDVSSVKHEVVSVKDEVASVKDEVVSVKDEVVSVKDDIRNVKSKVDNVELEVVSIKDEVSKQCEIDTYLRLSNVDGLAKFNFTGKIESLCERFQAGTRKWFFSKLSSWFGDENQESRAMILIAGPGVGKSVLSAKVCKLYMQRNQLAAYHFCDFTNSDSSNPYTILESLASHLCDNLSGFRDKLTEVLGHRHSRDSLSNAFRVLLQDPLHALGSHEPMLIVLDALDESKIDDKSEFLELISDVFPLLPKWIKIFISTRPELQAQKTLGHLKPFEIRPEDHNHLSDLEQFIGHWLPALSRDDVRLAIKKCQGSFLYAYYLVKELKGIDMGVEPDLNDFVPKGISGFYKKQFKRLQTGFQRFKQGVLKIFINVVAASKTPLPIKIFLRCMDLSDENYELRKAISDNMSEILPIYNNCLTVYHKSLQDWMTLDGYEEHAFVADVQDGNERLWRVCETIYKHIDSLESVIDYSLSLEEKFALENGLKYVEAVGELNNLHRFVNVNLIFLTLKFIPNLWWINLIDILRNYSELSDNLFFRIIQLRTVSKINEDNNFVNLLIQLMFSNDKSHETMPLLCYLYLQYLANGYFDFSKDIECKEKAKNILDKTNDIWIEEVAKVCSSNFKIVRRSVYELGRGTPYSVALSPDKKLLVCSQYKRVQLFQLPRLTLTFELKVVGKLGMDELKFSPDSSYCVFRSIRSCLRITKQNELEEVPFIPHGPKNINSISFSSCGNKVVTLEDKFIKVWDVRKKDLVAKIQIEEGHSDCLFSVCNQYIIATDYKTFGVWDLATLEKIQSASNNCVGSCLKSGDSFQIISPAISWRNADLSIYSPANHFHLPTGEIVLVTEKYLSEPFIWKNRKCVVVLSSTSLLAVCDIINKELVDILQIDCLPIRTCIHWVSHLDKTNFLVCLSEFLILLLSFETIHDHELLFASSDVIDALIKCCSISPDSDYIACCFENGILMVKSIDNGKILQSILLKHQPEACWWSELYLWVVCKGVVFKFRYGPSSVNVLGNCVEECNMHFDRVLKFAEGVLVIRRDGKNFLFKICNEKLHLQQIPHSSFSSEYVVAISSDGCGIVLLYVRNGFEFELWEEVSTNRWELCSNVSVADYFNSNWVSTSWLIGTSGSRCLETIHGFHEASFHIIDFSNKEERQLHSFPFYKPAPSYIRLGLEYFIAFVREWIYFVNKSDGKIIATVYLGVRNYKPSFCYYLGSRATLVIVEGNDIKFFKIHNIANYIKSDHNTYSNSQWQGSIYI